MTLTMTKHSGAANLLPAMSGRRSGLRWWLSRKLVRLNPALFVDVLRTHHAEQITRRLNLARNFDWDLCRLPFEPRNFEDLHSLFWTSPLNRGVLRQDLDEAAELFRTVRSIPAPSGVEIGRYFGGSTVLLAVAVGKQGKLLSIDNDPRDDSRLDQILKQTNLAGRVCLIRADANVVRIAHRLDFVLIDGDHSYQGAKRDHNQWASKIRPAGRLIYHDMAQARTLATQIPDLARLRLEILEQKDPPFDLETEAGSTSIWRRTTQPWRPL